MSTDTYEETSHLFNHVFPKLREYTLSRFGFEFQPINLSYDTNEPTEGGADRLLDESLREIDKCRALSIGPTFICLVGDEYGDRLLPPWFDRDTFEVLVECLQHDANAADVLALTHAYRLNKNYLNNRYEKQPAANDAERSLALFELIRTGMQTAIGKGLLPQRTLDELNQSSWFRLKSTDIPTNTFYVDMFLFFFKALHRQIERGTLNAEANTVHAFVRVGSTSNNNNNNEKMVQLRDKAINRYVPGEQIYRVRRSPPPPPPSSKDKDKENKSDSYLNTLGAHYRQVLERCIDKAVQAHADPARDPLRHDVLYHLNYMQAWLGETMTHQAAAKDLIDYVLDETSRQPLIVVGPAGTGKTHNLATFAANALMQLLAIEAATGAAETPPLPSSLVVRFIGIDEASTKLRSLLKSLCLQLAHIRRHDEHNDNKTQKQRGGDNNDNDDNEDDNEDDDAKKETSDSATLVPDNLVELKKFFRRCLYQGGKRRLIVVLDALDMLASSSADESECMVHKLDWLPKHLGPNCKLIVSVTTTSEQTRLVHFVV